MSLTDRINKAIKDRTVKKAGGVEELDDGIYGKKIHLKGAFEDVKNFMGKYRSYKVQPGATDKHIEFYQEAKKTLLVRYVNCLITLDAAKDGGTDVIIACDDEATTAATVTAFNKKFN